MPPPLSPPNFEDSPHTHNTPVSFPFPFSRPPPCPTALHLAALHGHLGVIRSLLAALQQHQQHTLQIQQHLTSPPTSPSAAAAAAAAKPGSTAAAAAATAAAGVSPCAKHKAAAGAAAAAGGEAVADGGVVVSSSSSSGSSNGAAVAVVPGVDVRNFNGDTPLMFAASSGHLGATALLLNVSVSWGLWRWVGGVVGLYGVAKAAGVGDVIQ